MSILSGAREEVFEQTLYALLEIANNLQNNATTNPEEHAAYIENQTKVCAIHPSVLVC